MGSFKALSSFASDQRLIGAVRAGDDEAFERIYDRHAGDLFAYAERVTGSTDDAEDAVLLSFLKAYAALRGPRAPQGFRPWLFATARRECSTVMQRRKREREAGEKQTASPQRHPGASCEEGPKASCSDIRSQLKAVSGGSLRRAILREHLLECNGCWICRIEIRAEGEALAA